MKKSIQRHTDPAPVSIAAMRLKKGAVLPGVPALQLKGGNPIQMEGPAAAQEGVTPERRIEIMQLIATQQSQVNTEKDIIVGFKKKDENKPRPGLSPGELGKLIDAIERSVAARRQIADLYVELKEPDPQEHAVKIIQEQSLQANALAQKG